MPDIFDRISPSPAPQTSDFSQYNTKLNPQEEIQFQGWKQKYAPNDSGNDYDLRGAFKTGIKPDPQRGHFPDTFKKPNHPTFSDQSQYSGKDGFIGGKWGDDNSFTPSSTNLKMRTPQELQNYFKTTESQSKLNLPQGDIFDRIAPDKPVGQPNLRSMVHQDLGTELGGVRDFLPAAGGMAAGIPGAAAGSFAKQALSSDPSITGGLVDTAVNGVIPAGIEAGFSGGIKASAARLISKLPQSLIDRIPGVAKAKIINQLPSKMVPEADNVAVAAENARNSPLSAPLTATEQEATHGLLDVPFQQTEISTARIRPIVKKMFSDVTDVRNAKLSGVSQQRLSSLATSDLVTRNFSAASKSFDAPKILEELSGTKADIYKEAMGPAYKTFKDLVQLGVDKGVGVKSMSPVQTMFYEGKRILFGGLAGSVLGLPSHVSAGLVLGSDAIAHIASDAKLGQLVIQAMKTPGTAPESTMLMKAIMNGLRGTTIYLQSGDGQQDPATIQSDQQGQPQLQYAKPQSNQ